MNQHRQTLHRRLEEVEGIGAQTRAVEANILKAATERLDTVNADIEKLRDRVMTDADAASRYETLITERGHLQQTIENSRRHLS